MEDHKIQVLKSHQSKLKDELDDVLAQKHRLNAEVEVIQLQLTAIEKQLKRNGGATSISSSSEPTASDSSQPDGKPSLRGMGFRDAMRAVMKNSARGLRPRDIARELRNSDFEYTAAVAIGTRVSNELYSLKRSGEIRRTQGGYYRLAP